MNLTPEKAELYQRRFTELDVHLYQETHEEDILLLKWWMLLIETGDITKVAIPEARRLTTFLQIFAFPTKTIYALDTFGRIEFIAWFTDASSSDKTVFIGTWTHSALRNKRRHLHLVRLIYEIAFELCDAILGKTWQPEILRLSLKLGYNIIGNIPNFDGEEVVYLIRLTKFDFYNSKFASIGG